MSDYQKVTEGVWQDQEYNIEASVNPGHNSFRVTIMGGPTILMGHLNKETMQELHGSIGGVSTSAHIYKVLKHAVLDFKDEEFFDFEE